MNLAVSVSPAPHRSLRVQRSASCPYLFSPLFNCLLLFQLLSSAVFLNCAHIQDSRSLINDSDSQFPVFRDLNLLVQSYIFIREGNPNPLQYTCLENPMVREIWQATVHRVTRVEHDLATKPPPMFL